MRKKLTDKMRYAVDIPDINNENEEWKCVAYFETKKEAIEYAQARFYADKRGRISLISSL